MVVLVVLGAMPIPMFVLGPGPGIVLAVGWVPVWGPVEAGRRLRVWWEEGAADGGLGHAWHVYDAVD